MENLDPPPPQIKDGKMARFAFARLHPCFGGGGGGDGGLLFHFISSKIVASPAATAFTVFPAVFTLSKSRLSLRQL